MVVVAVLALTLPFSAIAEEEGWSWEQNLLGYDPAPGTFDTMASAASVVLVPGEKGALTFAIEGEGQGLLPVPSEVRRFETLDKYIEFVADELNAEVDYDEKGVPVGWTLTTSLEGPAWYFDDERGDHVFATNPLAAYLGGRFGKIIVADKEICIDLAKCGGHELGQGYQALADGYNPSKYSINVMTTATSNYDLTVRQFNTCTNQGNGGNSWRNLKADLHLTDLRGRELADLADKWTNKITGVCVTHWVTWLGPADLMNVNNWPYNVFGAFGWHYGEGNGAGTSTMYSMCGGSCGGTACGIHPSLVRACQ